jgi:hypothetical protein
MKPLNKIMLWKRDRDRAALRAAFDEATARLAASVVSIANDHMGDKNEMLSRTFGQFQEHINKLMKRKTSLADIAALHDIFKNTDERSEPDLSRADVGYGGKTRRQYEDEAADDEDHRDDDDDNEKDQTNMAAKSLNDIVKRHGFLALAKSINAGAVTLTEEEYTKALVDDCARRGVSFEKAFCDNSAEGLEIRKGRERCRDQAFLKAGQGQLMPIAPTQVSGAAAQDVDGNSGGAYEQLMRMAQRMKEASPERKLSDAQWFESVYNDAANVELKRREREEAHARLPVSGGRIPI